MTPPGSPQPVYFMKTSLKVLGNKQVLHFYQGAIYNNQIMEPD
jgi:hypothetical protein